MKDSKNIQRADSNLCHATDPESPGCRDVSPDENAG